MLGANLAVSPFAADFHSPDPCEHYELSVMNGYEWKVQKPSYAGGGVFIGGDSSNFFVHNDISTWSGAAPRRALTDAPDGSQVYFYDLEDRRVFPTTSGGNIVSGQVYVAQVWLRANKNALVKIRRPSGQDVAVGLTEQWQYLEFVGTAVASSTNALLVDARYAQGLGAAGLEVAMFGHQIEAGAIASPYMDTRVGGVPVSRGLANAEQASVSEIIAYRMALGHDLSEFRTC